ncbi:hypothetical protein ACA910_012976 [Epithemia clementina (nom. ined.)]
MYNSRSTKKLRPGFVPDDLSWDVIDLDPYGSAAPFLDSAIQAVVNGGMIACTCTDMAALGGSRPHTCVGRYGAMPIPKAVYLQEMALRILLQSMAVTAAKYGRTIHPILSVGMDFYVRVFVIVRDDKEGVNDLSLKLGYVYQSTHCQSFEIVHMGRKRGHVYQPGRALETNCVESGSEYKVGGPMWTGPLHDAEFIQRALDRLSAKEDDQAKGRGYYSCLKYLSTKDRLRGLLLSCRDEIPDAPLFYRMSDMSRTLHVSTPPMLMVRNALSNAGYVMSAYHKDPQAVKTNAPNQVMWDIMRTWYQQQHPPDSESKKKIPKSGSVEEKILSRPIETKIDFLKPSNSNSGGRSEETQEHVARFPKNPQSHWGPKKAATGGNKRKASELEQP